LKDLSHPDFDLHRRRFEKWSRQRERMDAF
jgi:hypothetical protein